MLNNTKVIMLNGSARSGKNTVVLHMEKALQDLIPNSALHYQSTISEFKDIAKLFFNWDGEKTDEARQLLSALKIAYTEYNPNFIIDFINTMQEQTRLDTINLLVVDSRETEEIKQAKEHFGDSMIKSVLVVRPDIHIPNNRADMDVNSIRYDYVLMNNESLELLEDKVKELIRWLYS